MNGEEERQEVKDYSKYSAETADFEDEDSDEGNETFKPHRSLKTSLLLFMTRAQSASALVFSTFLLTHLSAPSLAVIGGLDAANRWLILGRAYYLPLEPIVVWGALGVHIASGLSKHLLSSRIWKVWRKTEVQADDEGLRDPELDLSKKSSDSRPLRVSWTLHAVTGYLLIPMVAYHTWTTRLLPKRLDITHLVNYSMVSYALRKRPYNYIQIPLYMLLVSALFYHVSGGLRKILSGGKKSATLGAARLRLGIGAVLGGGGLVGLGLARIVWDGAHDTPTWLLKRYEMIYLKSLPK